MPLLRRIPGGFPTALPGRGFPAVVLPHVRHRDRRLLRRPPGPADALGTSPDGPRLENRLDDRRAGPDLVFDRIVPEIPRTAPGKLAASARILADSKKG